MKRTIAIVAGGDSSEQLQAADVSFPDAVRNVAVAVSDKQLNF